MDEEFTFKATMTLPEEIIQAFDRGEITEDEIKSAVQNAMADNLDRQLRSALDAGMIIGMPKANDPMIDWGAQRYSEEIAKLPNSANYAATEDMESTIERLKLTGNYGEYGKDWDVI